jgi:hypothetical protein
MAKNGARLSAGRITISLGNGQREALEELAQRNGWSQYSAFSLS